MTKGIRLVRHLVGAGRLPREVIRPDRVWQFLPALVLFITLIVVAHGCHGPDEDHEPTVIIQADQD
jgi:hypothetical protein